MKIRTDFVTNSSSSSFIITNKTDKRLTSEEVTLKLLEKIINDSKGRFTIEPGKSIDIVCGDNNEDGPFENFIHNEAGCLWCKDYFTSDEVEVILDESYH